MRPMEFDPDAAAAPGGGLFGLPFGPDDAQVHVMGVPFDATTSYRGGTATGPAAIRAASEQVDLYDRRYGRIWETGIWMAEPEGRIVGWNHAARTLAAPILAQGGATEDDASALVRVEELCEQMNDAVRAFAERTFASDRLPVLVGGDHSTPFGLIVTAAKVAGEIGVLQFDAHADLREAYEGLRWSHASIMWNVLEAAPGVTRVLQVGLRDLGERELERIDRDERVRALFDDDLAEARLSGRVREVAREAIATLPAKVHVSFDIDGLDPTLCPNTGTPVPGGLGWDEVMVWLDELARSGKHVVSLDLNEVSPGPAGDPEGVSWDAIVGARLLYKLIGAGLESRSCVQNWG